MAKDKPLGAAVFEVELYQKNQNLEARIQVISLTPSSAANYVKRQFFTGDSWKVIKVKKIRVI